MAGTLICAPFPNTHVHHASRRIGRGDLAGGYRATVRTVEHSAWSRPCVSRWQSAVAFADRADADAFAEAGAREAARTGYVPSGFTLLA